MGDLVALAESIAAEGLLRPIAVIEANEIVSGEGRLRATGDIVGRTEIAVEVVNVTSIVPGEYAENVFRKDFSTSERVSLADAIRQLIGNRARRAHRHRSEGTTTLPRGVRTRAHAASLPVFASDGEYRVCETCSRKARAN
jgi:ParB family chromosome partitioning protein